MNQMQLFGNQGGLCCWDFMRLETGAFLVLYFDLACLVGQLAYMAASIMIQCCTIYNLIWFLCCMIQAVLCVILFRAISNRHLSLLKLYIAIGIAGRAIILGVWVVIILVEGFGKKAPFYDNGQLVLIGFLIFCLFAICFCGVVLFRCLAYFKQLHEKANKCPQYRQIKLCPHKDHMHRENSGLLSTSTSNNQNFLLHELDLEKLHDADSGAKY
ncbi:hypothetical protein M3Y97_00803300 [Aphelenchoides bicaudatus]|nr:hypothetical protein M3Y97_00803300 [Aphelenchoides bicaudatus]